MQSIEILLESSTMPVVTAFLLGLLTAISPCPMATNITAIGFIGKNIENPHRVFLNGMLYTLGRVITYTALGLLIIPILRQGASIYAIQEAISRYGEMVIAPALILIGVFMLFSGRISLSKFGYSGGGGKLSGSIGALLLGVLFSLAFCPSSGVFYFGMLMPLAAAQSGGLLLPLVFAVATSLPVMVVAWILAYSVAGIGTFYHRMQVFQKWMNLAIALLFIAVGIYYAVILHL